MWQPIDVQIQNFISHKDSTYVFKQGVPEIINGLNLDDEGQESNGSGKSAIVEAAFVCLTGTSFRKVKQNDLIRGDKDSCTLIFRFENKKYETVLEVERTLQVKGPTLLSIKENDKDVKFATVNDGNKKILEIIGITRDDLMSYFIVSKDSHTPFFTSSDTRKKEIIGRFSGANSVDSVDTVIAEKQAKIEESVQKIEKKVSSITGKIEVYEDQIEDVETEEEFEERLKKAKSQYEEKIKSYKEKIKTKKEEIQEIKSTKIPHQKEVIEKLDDEISDLQENIDKLDKEDLSKKVDKINKKKQTKEKTKKELREAINEYQDFLDEIERNLKGTVECPKCSHEFSITDKDFDVEAGREQKPAVKEMIKAEEISKQEIESDISKLDKEKREIDKLTQETRKKKNQIQKDIDSKELDKMNANRVIKSLEIKIDNCQEDIDSQNINIQRANENIESIDDEEFEDKASILRKDIQKLQKDEKNKHQELKDLEAQMEKLRVWSHRFKKFKTHLSNKSITSIEAFTNYYLKKMHCNLSVSIEGYKVLSDGSLKDNISIQVNRNGIAEGAFEKFSGGERVRILIANILSLQKLINLNSDTGGLDLLILDEIIESVDPKGVTEILQSLNLVNQTVRVITHASTSRSFIDDITVIKENGFSRIEEDFNFEIFKEKQKVA